MNDYPDEWHPDIPPDVRQASLEMLLSDGPADKRRIDELEALSRERGLSFEALVTAALYRYIRQ
jgi:hypothetical protein